MKAIDILNKSFGILTASYPETRNGRRFWICECECGNRHVAQTSDLVRGDVTHCGCLKQKRRKEKAVEAAKHKSEKNSWCEMIRRCYTRKTAKNWKYYGGRTPPVTVCARWLHPTTGFGNFLKDMGKKPSPQHSLDRYPDPAGNYEPGNCRWATQSEQCRNKRNTKKYTVGSLTLSLIEWAEHTGWSIQTLSDRLRRKWDIVRVFTEPPTRPESRHGNAV